MFSVKKKDGLARIGTLISKHGKMSTPILLPVINPNRQMIPIEDMIKCGAESFITNAYLLYRNPMNRERVLKEGLHEFIGFSGPLMTDSGAFQLMEYGEVSVTNQEITEFQEQIGSDIGVFLDVPIKKGTYEESRMALEETLQRANEHIQYRNSTDSTLWAGPIQGGEHLDLIKKSCLEMKDKDFNVHPIGSVVPLLEKYDFESVIRIILSVKQHLPSNRPIHLFGAGHPMFFAISVFLGVDMFDSAAYILYAKKNRYITEFGTDYLEKLQYLPCSCDVCKNYTAAELKQLEPEIRTILLAKHNLNVSFEEIRRIKQAIIDGRLNELALSRAMNHPSLSKALDLLFGTRTSRFIEQYEPISKSRSLLITHPILTYQPIIQRYKNRVLGRFYFWSPNLLIGQDFQKLHSSTSYQVIKLSPLFGVIPDELRGVYPLVQHERVPMSFSQEIIEFISQFLEKYRSKFKQVEIHPSVNLDMEEFHKIKISERTNFKNKLNEIHILNAIVDYQYGVHTHSIFEGQDLIIKRSQKTGVLRHFSDASGLLGTFRPSDFSIIPTKSFAQRLHQQIKPPRLRVVATRESIPFIVNKKDLLAKFVLDVDPEIRCGEEVFIVDDNDTFLSFGKSVLAASEMVDFDRGVAVHVRR